MCLKEKLIHNMMAQIFNMHISRSAPPSSPRYQAPLLLPQVILLTLDVTIALSDTPDATPHHPIPGPIHRLQNEHPALPSLCPLLHPDTLQLAHKELHSQPTRSTPSSLTSACGPSPRPPCYPPPWPSHPAPMWCLAQLLGGPRSRLWSCQHARSS